MRVLIVGGGGREHSLVWKLKAESRVSTCTRARERGDRRELAECVDISVSEVRRLADFAANRPSS